MVIFGAGASYDSAQAFRPSRPQGGSSQSFGLTAPTFLNKDDLWRPPLSDGLFLDPHRAFGTYVERYPKIRSILPLLRERSGQRSVEQVLESFQKEAEGRAERHHQLASVRFYLRDLLYACTSEWLQQTSGVTNYASLADQILHWHQSEKEPICLVTFNYDLLLEAALGDFGFQPQEPEKFLDSHPVLKVFKLHGSVNWARYVDWPSDVKIGARGLIEFADTIRLRPEYATVEQNENDRGGLLLFPSIAIPVQTKTESYFECPPEHLEHLKGLLEGITKILIVGWQAREAHFLALLKSKHLKLKRLMVVSGGSEDGKNILNHFMGETGLSVVAGQTSVFPGGFTDFVVSRHGDEFFKT